MDLKKIRTMNDSELEYYLKGLASKRTTECIKCGKINANYTMNIQSKRKMQQKKLCNLCEACYTDLLDYLGTCDIIWED